MRRMTLIAIVAAAGVYAAFAVAAKPPHPTNGKGNAPATTFMTSTTTTTSSPNMNGKSAKVLFVVHGTVTAYTAANGSTNGSISLTFKSSNHESSLLKAATQPLTFVVSSATKVVLDDGKPVASGDHVLVKLRAAKNAPVATLEATASFQIVDQGTRA